MERVGTGAVLAGLGLLLVLAIIEWGIPSSAFDSLWAIFLRIGFLYILLGVAIAASQTMTVARAAAIGVIALAITFLVGLATRFYPLVVTSTPVASVSMATHLIANQVTVTLGLTPVPVGFLAGILEWQNRPNDVRKAWIASVLLSLLVGFALVVARDYFGIVVIYFTFSAVLGALPPLLLTRQMKGRDWVLNPTRSGA